MRATWIVLAALLALAPGMARAAIFDDGNDRHFVKDLRAKPAGQLTTEEKAVLAAANKVGLIGFCGGKNNGNAYLILFRGRPAVVTAAHFPFDSQNGKLFCPSEAEFVKSMAYVPNSSHYDPAHPNRDKAFVFRKVDLEFPPANWDEVKGKAFSGKQDFLVFFLKEDIIRDRMPDGSLRGYLKPSRTPPHATTEGSQDFRSAPPLGDSLSMLGVPGDMGTGEMVYQTRCDGFIKAGDLYHGCDGSVGSSAAMIGTLEDGEITWRGHQTSGWDNGVLPAADKEKVFGANVGTNAEYILRLEDSFPRRPGFMASDLQGLLSVAGCYTGKLDNRWGPASREALEAFAKAAGITPPGTEPSMDLLEAVEHAAPAGTEVCR